MNALTPMIFLFVGMIASGISARVTLLSHRGGWFLEDQARKSSTMVVFDLIGTIAGLTAFGISFFLFDWWWPLIALAVGYWLIAPFLVTRSSYALFYNAQFLTALVSLFCSLVLCNMYFRFI